MRILVAMNDKSASQKLADVFRADGYAVDVAGYNTPKDITGGIENVGSTPYKLIVHDAELPADSIKGVPARLAVVANEGIQEAFQSCAMCKISPDDNDASIRKKAAFRLAQIYGLSGNGIVRSGPFEMDLLNRKAKVDGKDLPLTPKEYAIFRSLCLHQGRLIKPAEIAEHVYDSGAKVESETALIRRYFIIINNKMKEILGHDDCRIKSQGHNGYLMEGIDLSKLGQIKFGGLVFALSTMTLIGENDTKILTGQQAEFLVLLKDKRLKTYGFLRESLGNISMSQLKLLKSKVIGSMEDVSGENYIKMHRGEGFQLCDTPVPLSKVQITNRKRFEKKGVHTTALTLA